MKMSEVNEFTHGSNMPILRGELRINEPMSKHTSWRAGGEAARFYKPADIDDLAVYIQGLPDDEPITFVGLGSNLLVRDGGLKGTVVALHGKLKTLMLVKQDVADSLIYASAGVACAKVARFTALHDFTGAEFLAGIPGTMGGALAMNAGCYGSETWDIVKQVQVMDRKGQLYVRQPNSYDVGYRHVVAKGASNHSQYGEWFVGGWLCLKRGDHVTSMQNIKELLVKRINSQPLNLPNSGSVFRNPPGHYAARLIESCGLKGFCVGGAMVSPKHANFIINTGGATAADIESVIQTVKGIVKNKKGIVLIQEVRIIGDAGSLLNE